MTITPLRYECDGLALTGYLALPKGPLRAGVLVGSDATGMSEHTKKRALELASVGYAALAIDLYGKEGLTFQESQHGHKELMETPGLLYTRARAGLDALAGQPGILPDRLAAIGFCQGGIVALELARHGAPIRAAVGFHPALRRPAGSPDGPITAKILMLIGEEDPVIKPEERAAFERDMIASGADWQLHVFGRVGHAYTDPGVDVHKIPGIRYDARADQRGWAMMLALLAEDFG